MNIVLGKKLKMSRVFTDDGVAVPVTSIGVGDISGFEVGSKITVSGKSKGKGFSGVMKRWGFRGGPRTHGQSDRRRAPGSIGGGTDPGRVWPGQKMPGRAGGKRVTVKGLRVVEVDKNRNLIKVAGSVPGARRGKLEIKKLRN